MAIPRPQKTPPWTRAEHEENARRLQRRKDAEIWDRLAKKLGVRGRDLAAAFGRLILDQLTTTLRAHKPSSYDPVNPPADVDALRGVLTDLISDDVAEMFQILSGNETDDQSRDTEETSESGSEDTPHIQREFYDDESERPESEDA